MPITISGATAQDWINSGVTGGFSAIALGADPAGSAPVTYTPGSGASSVFDATDRDGLTPTGAPHGIGVNNTTIQNGNPGVTSVPSEIGYYGQTPDSFFPDGSRTDSLTVDLGEDVTGVSAEVSFFYAGEAGNPEQLTYELIDDGSVVFTKDDVTASGNGSFSSTNPGLFSFDLDGGSIEFDAIRFSGSDIVVADANDFLLESITVEEPPEVFTFEKAVSNVVVYADCEGEDGVFDTKIKFDGFDEITDEAGEPIEIFSLSSDMFEDAIGEDCDALGVTIKAGNNDGGFGPGEGQFYDLVAGDDLETGTAEKADIELAAADYTDIWLG